MFDYETEYPAFGANGAPLTYCEVCGMPVSHASYLTAGNGTSPAVSDRLLRVCSDCFAEIGYGDVKVFADGAGTLATDSSV